MTKKRKRILPPKEIIDWVWEDDDPAAAPCESGQMDFRVQSVEPAKLVVYANLLACRQAKEEADGRKHEPAILDGTLTNILVFADDCRTAVEWLTSEVVSHADEQGRRAGQRRRHLKERGRLTNGMRYVQLCGQWITSTDAIAAAATRECIDDWEEIGDRRSLHFHEEEAGVRWDPCSAENARTATMHLANPYSAPPATPEDDGRTVTQYRVELVSDEDADPMRNEAERSRWTNDTSKGKDDPIKGGAAWTLNQRAEAAMEWLSGAAETAGDIVRHGEDETLKRFFPNLQEIQREERRCAAQRRAANTHQTAGTSGKYRGQTIH